MWHGYCKDLLNATSNTVNKRSVTQQCKCCKADDFTVSLVDVKEAVKDLKKGKRAGLDNLTSRHFKYPSDKLYVLLLHLTA